MQVGGGHAAVISPCMHGPWGQSRAHAFLYFWSALSLLGLFLSGDHARSYASSQAQTRLQVNELCCWSTCCGGAIEWWHMLEQTQRWPPAAGAPAPTRLLAVCLGLFALAHLSPALSLLSLLLFCCSSFCFRFQPGIEYSAVFVVSRV